MWQTELSITGTIVKILKKGISFGRMVFVPPAEVQRLVLSVSRRNEAGI